MIINIGRYYFILSFCRNNLPIWGQFIFWESKGKTQYVKTPKIAKMQRNEININNTRHEIVIYRHNLFPDNILLLFAK